MNKYIQYTFARDQGCAVFLNLGIIVCQHKTETSQQSPKCY